MTVCEVNTIGMKTKDDDTSKESCYWYRNTNSRQDTRQDIPRHYIYRQRATSVRLPRREEASTGSVEKQQ